MSRELAYFAPNGTKYKWGSKALTYSDWVCDLSAQKEPKLFLFPMRILLRVDKINARWQWSVAVTDFSYQRYEVKGSKNDPLQACLEAEKVGEEQMESLLPAWTRTALENGWRPPFGPRSSC